MNVKDVRVRAEGMVRCGNHPGDKVWHASVAEVRECHARYVISRPARVTSIFSLPIARWAWEGDARGLAR